MDFDAFRTTGSLILRSISSLNTMQINYFDAPKSSRYPNSANAASCLMCQGACAKNFSEISPRTAELWAKINFFRILTFWSSVAPRLWGQFKLGIAPKDSSWSKLSGKKRIPAKTPALQKVLLIKTCFHSFWLCDQVIAGRKNLK